MSWCLWDGVQEGFVFEYGFAESVFIYKYMCKQPRIAAFEVCVALLQLQVRTVCGSNAMSRTKFLTPV